MFYAILRCQAEQTFCAWTPAGDAAVMARLAVVEARLAAAGRLGPVAA